MSKLNWTTFHDDGKRYSYAARFDGGQYTIDPKPKRGYYVQVANQGGLINMPHSGLWHEIGSFSSPQLAKSAAQKHFDAHDAKRKANPAPRKRAAKKSGAEADYEAFAASVKKRAVSRPSQVTKKAPSKRLVARRKVAAKKPVKGYFPNPGGTSINRFPLEVQYYVPVNDNWITIAKLPAEYIELAKKVAKAAAMETSFKIRVIKK